MKSIFLNSIKQAIKHWYIPLLIGILFILVSIIVFSAPISSFITLSILFAISFLFGGLSEVVFAISNRDQLDNWGWSLALGIITSIMGVLLLLNPGLTMTALALYIGFVLLFRSISSISFALDIKKHGSKGWVTLLIFGVLGAIFSFILIWNPVFAGLSVMILIGVNFLLGGILSIYLALQLRKLHKHVKELSPKLQERYQQLQDDIRKEWEN